MIKKFASLVLAMAFVAATVAASYAESCKGEVTAVSGTTVTVKCKDGSEVKAEGSAKVGDSVSVKDGKIEGKKKAVEGC